MASVQKCGISLRSFPADPAPARTCCPHWSAYLAPVCLSTFIVWTESAERTRHVVCVACHEAVKMFQSRTFLDSFFRPFFR